MQKVRPFVATPGKSPLLLARSCYHHLLASGRLSMTLVDSSPVVPSIHAYTMHTAGHGIEIQAKLVSTEQRGLDAAASSGQICGA